MESVFEKNSFINSRIPDSGSAIFIAIFSVDVFFYDCMVKSSFRTIDKSLHPL